MHQGELRPLSHPIYMDTILEQEAYLVHETHGGTYQKRLGSCHGNQQLFFSIHRPKMRQIRL